MVAKEYQTHSAPPTIASMQKVQVILARRRHSATRFAAALVALAFVAQGCGDGVTAPLTVSAVEIAPLTPVVIEGDSVQLTTVVKGSDGAVLTNRVVTWSSANTSTATVSATGLVTGIAPGRVAISAAAEGKQGTVNVTVTLSPCNVAAAVPIVSGRTVNGTIAATDCSFGDDTYLDVFKFTLAVSTSVDVLLRSTAFDAYLFIYSLDENGALVKRAEDDNSGGGTDARLTGIVPAGTHFILANSRIAAFGAYTLQFTAPFPGAGLAGVWADAGSLRSANVSIPLQRVTTAQGRLLRGLVRRPN